MSNATTVIQPSQLKLAHALLVLKQWQEQMDAQGVSRHGKCLQSIRFALAGVGLHLPPAQPRPNNVALWCGHELAQMPDKYGWERVTPPFDVRYSLDFYSSCGRLPDGRVAGHIAITDHKTRELLSCTTYPLDKWWIERRFASFVPSL